MLPRPPYVRPPFPKIFFFETAWPIKDKILCCVSLRRGTKLCINGPGHMTKMAAMRISAKNLKTEVL